MLHIINIILHQHSPHRTQPEPGVCNDLGLALKGLLLRYWGMWSWLGVLVSWATRDGLERMLGHSCVCARIVV